MVGNSLRDFYKIISADFILLPVSLNECELPPSGFMSEYFCGTGHFSSFQLG